MAKVNPYLKRLGDHTWWSLPDESTDRPVLAAVAGETHVLMVDAGNSPAHAAQFLAALEDVGVAAPDYVALTHWHWDHVFGAASLPGLLIAQEQTAAQLAQMATWKWTDAAIEARVEAGIEITFCRDRILKELSEVQRKALVIRQSDLMFRKRLDIDLGGVTCQVAHVGGDHGRDSAVVHVVEDGVVFLGDCTSPNFYADPKYYTPRGLPRLMENLLAFEATLFFHAHMTEPMTRPQVAADAARYKRLANVVDRLDGDREAILAEVERLTGAAATEDDLETIDQLIAGLSIFR
jgi:glyoxylase-like metal-dependent hydrolase (beta-lactamase superfamily II)